MLVERLAIYQAILKLAGRRVRGLNQYEDTLTILLAYINERLYTISSQIGVNGSKIFCKGFEFLRADLDLTKMSNCIGFGCGSDITTLNIADDKKALRMCIVNRLLESHQSGDTELFVHGNLGLHSRNQISYSIHNGTVETENCICSSFQGLTVSGIRLLKKYFRDKGKFRIQSDNNRCILLFDFLRKLMNHIRTSLFSISQIRCILAYFIWIGKSR